MRTLVVTCCLLAFGPDLAAAAGPSNTPNILLITVDDMNCDSVGAFGSKLAGTTPHIDQLASQSLQFRHAHVQVGNCMPSRNVLMSGRFPHNNRVEGFYQVRDPDYPILVDLMKTAGYFTAIRGKVTHTTPFNPYPWDLVLDAQNPRSNLKNVRSYYESTRDGIAASREQNKPFCLAINVSDPHKPFYGMTSRGQPFDDPNKPSRIFTADEVPVPGFLFDHPAVRKELAHYYSSVRRADDCVGATLQALSESGLADDTLVVFLSDHGMPFPFAKTALYNHSTHTPLIVRWPGHIRASSMDDRHLVSAVDLLPTLLDIAGIPHPAGLDGRSFEPLLRGEPQDGRDAVFTVYNENSGGVRQPMRGVRTRRFGYLFNPWSDGTRIVRTATQGTETYRVMKRLAPENPALAARLELFEHRVREEFYDYDNDPDALHNLIDDPKFANEVRQHRQLMEQFMSRTSDPALEAFRHRDDEAAVQAWMSAQEAASQARRAQRRQRKQNPQPRQKKPRRQLISLKPKPPMSGTTFTVIVSATLPAELGQQQCHVTLKSGKDARRLDRKVITIGGTAETSVTFTVPEDAVRDGVILFSAFVGDDYQHNLQHVTTAPVRVASGGQKPTGKPH